MNRLIRRQQVIDCGKGTCGRCKQRRHNRCDFFPTEELIPVIKRVTTIAGWKRCYLCMNAEVKQPWPSTKP